MLSLFGRKRSHASLALRLALTSALFGLIVASGAIVAGYWALSQQLDARAAAEMQGRRELLLHILKDVPSLQVVADPGHRFTDLFYGHDDLHLELVEARTGRVAASIPDSAPETTGALRDAAVPPGEYHTWVTAKNERFSGINGTAALANGEQLLFYLTVDRRRDATLLGDFVKATLVAVPSLMLGWRPYAGSTSWPLRSAQSHSISVFRSLACRESSPTWRWNSTRCSSASMTVTGVFRTFQATWRMNCAHR